ncbi:acyltransferase family protein [Kosakonia radicincitans]|uniref:acyltransferase family protein n=1 Tax=Kosakonia radicincitans TaxID=283686 RepID=UPI00164353ED|nr:acyltransferase [Kosakonia radicincitans]
MEITVYSLIGILFVPATIMYIVHTVSPKSIRASFNASSGGYNTIEPLRGVAASLVAISHSFFSYNLTNHGAWKPLDSQIAPISNFVENVILSFGGGGVILFFMITGFLFCDKAIRANGNVDFKKFYIGRFFRIVPAYIFIALFILLVSFLTGYYHYSTWKEYILSIVSWLTFGLSDPMTISAHIDKYLIIAGVLWTLNVEWKFYFLYPLICQFSRGKIAFISLSVFFLMVCALLYLNFFNGNNSGIFLSFIAGGFAAIAVNWEYGCFRRILKNNIFALIGLVICLTSLYMQFDVYSFPSWFGIFILFLSISQGCSIFGLLNIAPIRWLGVISYSLYLSHGVFFFLFNKIFLNGYGYFIPAVSGLSLAIIFSVISYHFVEKRGIMLGKLLTDRKKYDEKVGNKSLPERSVFP